MGYDTMIADLMRRLPSFGTSGTDAYKPGLERMKEMCRRMGNPQSEFKTVHVAGTNGKGSTCNMLTAHFAGSGKKVGLYTSPHISDFRERVRTVTVSGHFLVSRDAVTSFLTRYDADIRELELSFFEVTTALSFWFFAAEKVDLAVIETGLGGRLDATNVITPILSVITNIGYDHTNLLGNTLPLIAREKAGIIKAGVPVVVGEWGDETAPVFAEAAGRAGSPIVFADREYTASATLAGELAGRLDLGGSYQAKNLRTALCALDVLGQKPDMAAIASAAAICGFHGRWETVCDSPRTIVDIGHNEHGLKYNFRQLDGLLDSGEFSDLVMVYGSVRDKDVDAVLRILPSRARVWFAAAHNDRAMPAEELMRRIGNAGVRLAGAGASVSVDAAVREAVDFCSALARPLLYIGGSTYIVSEALPVLQRMGLLNLEPEL